MNKKQLRNYIFDKIKSDFATKRVKNRPNSLLIRMADGMEFVVSIGIISRYQTTTSATLPIINLSTD